MSLPPDRRMLVEHSHSEEETLRLGEEIGQVLNPPRVVLLYGELGSGKTLLTRGLAQGLGVDDSGLIRSPSFTLVNQYQGKKSLIYHVDLYRLDGLRDLYSIGLDEILASRSIVIIEWAEKLLIEVTTPLQIRIFVDLKSGARRFEIEGAADTLTR